MNSAKFERIVAAALDALPTYFQEKMSNIDVLIKPWPGEDELYEAGVPADSTLLGLYNGIPLTERTHFYGAVPPDTITLYQRPIELEAGSPERIPEVVKHTIIHEVAHHFGISDDRLHELGAY